MRHLVLLLAIAGCKKSKGPADAPPPAIALDGEPGEVDETAIRAGKRTGLEGPDSKPEVATEPLLRALLAGEVPWTRFVDPTAGVVELRGTEVQRRCGADLEQAFATFSAAVTAALADPGLVFDILCDNAGLTVTIAGVTSHAVCTASSPTEDGVEYDVVFVPDAARGLELIGLAAADVSVGDDVRDRLDEEMGRYGARCP
jgi:hypothetical protein